jgi:hypothetical protein
MWERQPLHLRQGPAEEARTENRLATGQARSPGPFSLDSMDDVLFRAEPRSLGKEPELSSDEVVRTFRLIAQRGDPDVRAKRTAAGTL